MSSEPEIMIRVQALSKRYEIYQRPRDRLLQMLVRGRRQYFREFWALRDVSFEIRRGETVGIIGRNGSGKSTLLQLICGTLNPTAGRIEVNGRVAALLELGAGFNPEFSGRENVFMAAKLLGLTHAQVEERFDKIAAFADIGEFIEQPVKTYSSGMYVRLAFAVNAHVDADILVIDEALAVGDAVFTQRCMRFIRNYQQRGTLLFVSHDTSAVQNLCASAIWLSAGQVRAIGPSRAVAEDYLQYTMQETYGEETALQTVRSGRADDADPASEADADAETASAAVAVDYDAMIKPVSNLANANGWKTGAAEITDVRLETSDGTPSVTLKGGERVRLRIGAIAHQQIDRPIVGFLVRDRLGQDLFGENTLAFTNLRPVLAGAGRRFEAHFTFTLPMLPNGSYAVMASIADGDLYDHVQHHWLHDALILQVSSAKVRYGLVGLRFEEVGLKVTE
jgi:lipopolysaccharide transport system ATP-binding protein